MHALAAKLLTPQHHLDVCVRCSYPIHFCVLVILSPRFKANFVIGSELLATLLIADRTQHHTDVVLSVKHPYSKCVLVILSPRFKAIFVKSCRSVFEYG